MCSTMSLEQSIYPARQATKPGLNLFNAYEGGDIHEGKGQ